MVVLPAASNPTMRNRVSSLLFRPIFTNVLPILQACWTQQLIVHRDDALMTHQKSADCRCCFSRKHRRDGSREAPAGIIVSLLASLISDVTALPPNTSLAQLPVAYYGSSFPNKTSSVYEMLSKRAW